MITINSGKLTIPEEEFIIGFAGDSLNLKKQFVLENISDQNCVHSLCLKFNADTITDIVLDSNVENGSTILTWDISKEDIPRFGLIKVQIKSVFESGKVTHTSWDYFYIYPSNEFSEKFENIDISDFFDYKAKITEVYDKIEDTDFSTFVSNDRTIAGIKLTDDIEASALCDALAVCPTIIKEGAPTAFDGNTGEYLIDTLNDDLYYCKESNTSGNSWIKLNSNAESVNSIKKAQINESGELVLTFNDDSTSTVGVVVGKNGKDGEDGYDGIDGMDGEDGKDGYTPIKGVDYFTEDDKAEIVTQAKAELSQISPPTVVNSVDEMTDTNKHYVLNSYIYAYMSNNGGLKPDFTNLVDTTPTTDTTITTSSEGWLENVRINSSSAITTEADNHITNIIPVGNTDVLRVKGMDINGGYGRIYLYKGTSLVRSFVPTSFTDSFISLDDTYAEIRLQAIREVYATSDITFDSIRIGGTLNNTKDDVIVTLDEEIAYVEAEGYEWQNTGLQYTATLYTDLIGIVDENNVIRLSSNNLPSGTYTLKYGDESFDTIGTITVA